jgi:hypothetical protein
LKNGLIIRFIQFFFSTPNKITTIRKQKQAIADLLYEGAIFKDEPMGFLDEGGRIKNYFVDSIPWFIY